MPYRVDVSRVPDHALDRLVELGALDVEPSQGGGLAALMPDRVSPEDVARALGVADVSFSAARSRDAGSVWLLNPRPFRVGRLRIAPADTAPDPDTLRLVDGPAFGTGLHPTTSLCLEALEETIGIVRPDALLDVGTGSGILALGALLLGVPRALGLDIDGEALRVAGENARINGLEDRLQLACGGPDTVPGSWPLVLANVVAAPLVAMAPALVRRVGHQGRLVLSGIPSSVEHEVDLTYRRMGMRRVKGTSRGGWVALVMQSSW